MKSAVRLLLLCGLVVTFSTGCYSYKVDVPEQQAPRATEVHSETGWSFLWGLVERPPEIDNCQGPGLAEVSYETNLGFALITVVTLGTVAPATVEWQCAAPDPGLPDSEESTVQSTPESSFAYHQGGKER